MHMLKKWNIFENFATSKSFFANIYQSQSKSYQVLKIEGPFTYNRLLNKRTRRQQVNAVLMILFASWQV